MASMTSISRRDSYFIDAINNMKADILEEYTTPLYVEIESGSHPDEWRTPMMSCDEELTYALTA